MRAMSAMSFHTWKKRDELQGIKRCFPPRNSMFSSQELIALHKKKKATLLR